MRTSSLIAVVALAASVEAFAANPQVDQVTRELPIESTGTLWLHNPYGSIDVIGTDDDKMTITLQRQVTASDDQAMKDARQTVLFGFEGDSRTRVVRTSYPEPHDPRWIAVCNYIVRVPRTVSVKISARAMEHIRLTQLSGSVTVNSFSGTIILSNVSGASTVQTVNGRVIYDYAQRPTADATVQVINADIDIYAPREAQFRWIADSLNGDLMTNFDLRGVFQGNVFHGYANNPPASPTLRTTAVTGRVSLLTRGTSPANARRIVAAVPSQGPGRNVTNSPGPSGPPAADASAPLARKIQIPILYLDKWDFSANVADVEVGQIHGSTRITTGAGEVSLGVVFGSTEVDSGGGPLTFGDLVGPIDVHTDAGDVTIRASRQGGTASTDGGIVRVTYAGGPMILRSGGGDIIVQQAAAGIDALTRSGDISITNSPVMKSNHIIAKTSQGNVTLIVSPTFAADIDATVVTDDADANRIRSDFNLSVQREVSSGGKTRLHATGQINGGGDRIELYAEDGSINISQKVITPIGVPRPRQ